MSVDAGLYSTSPFGTVPNGKQLYNELTALALACVIEDVIWDPSVTKVQIVTTNTPSAANITSITTTVAAHVPAAVTVVHKGGFFYAASNNPTNLTELLPGTQYQLLAYDSNQLPTPSNLVVLSTHIGGYTVVFSPGQPIVNESNANPLTATLPTGSAQIAGSLAWIFNPSSGGNTTVAVGAGDGGTNTIRDHSGAQTSIALARGEALLLQATGDATASFEVLVDTRASAPSITVVDAGSDTTTWVLLATSQTGSMAPATDAGIAYNASTNALTLTGSCDSSAVGPFIAIAAAGTIGTALTLDATTLSSGHKFSFISTGGGAAPGAGQFAVYDGTADKYVFLVDATGRYIAGRNTYSYIGQVTIYPYQATQVGLCIQGFTSQSGDYFQVRDSDGNVKVNITSAYLTSILANCDSSAVGPMKLVAVSGGNDIGTALTLDATALTGGHKFSFLATGPSASAGAGIFSFYDGTADKYICDFNGNGECIHGLNQHTALGQVTIYPYQASEKGLVIKGAASRSVALMQLQTSAGGSLGNVGGTIFNDFTDTTTTHTDGTEDDLYSYTTVANTFAINGDSVEEVEHVQFVGSATAARRLKKYFAGTLIFDSGSLTLSAGGDFTIWTNIIRESSTIVRVTVSVTTTSASTVPYSTYTRITSLTLTGTNILKTTGIASGVGAASGDILNKLSKVWAYPAA